MNIAYEAIREFVCPDELRRAVAYFGSEVGFWDGACYSFATSLFDWLRRRCDGCVRLVELNPRDGSLLEPNLDAVAYECGPWTYHMVVVWDGDVHDPWFPELVLPVDGYTAEAFPNQYVDVLYVE